MGAAIGEILGFAVAVAISPVPIIAVILMLFTAGARSNSVGFVSGRLIGFLLAGGVVLAIGLEASEGGASDVNGVIKILIGALFLFLGWEQWSGRPQGDEEAPMPAAYCSPLAFAPARYRNCWRAPALGHVAIVIGFSPGRGLEECKRKRSRPVCAYRLK